MKRMKRMSPNLFAGSQDAADGMLSEVLLLQSTSAFKLVSDADQQLETLRTTVAASLRIIHGCQNALRPINRLPPEIFIYIIQTLSKTYFGGDPFPSYYFLDAPQGHLTQSAFRWIGLLQVCQCWRHTILAAPDLCSTIFAPSPALFTLFLGNSGSIPLRIYTNSDSWIDDLVPHLSRVCELRIKAQGSGQSLEVLSSPALLLESLDIICDGDPTNYDTVYIPELFNQETPCLRKLVLENIAAWSSNSFRNLTHLYLSGYLESGPGNRETYERLIELLRSNASLEVFMLRSPHPWIPQHQFVDNINFTDGIVPVELTRLKKLFIGNASVAHVRQLLSNLVLPDELSMVFGCTKTTSSQRDVLSWYPDPSEGTPTLLREDITSLRIHFATNSLVTGVGPSKSFHAQTHFYLPTRTDPPFPYNEGIRRLTYMPFTSRLTELWLSGATIGNHRIRLLFEELVSLKKLVILDGLLSSYITELNPRFSEASNSQTGGVFVNLGGFFAPPSTPCPNLDTLWIRNFERTFWADTYLPLLECAQGRFAAGDRVLPLRELRIQWKPGEGGRCGGNGSGGGLVPRMGVSELKEVVGVVEFAANIPDGFDLPSCADEPIYRNGVECWPRWKR
ncbi:hypothetical protein BXZ70DRAFT_338346 [Cristinia sonorae]|uniref:F-box domain-containing protein n=1 Tax=Cristinia sonorae TaxID=1940300 RepID=A0A8K0XMY7_9AGAR|nr:hypothetical protein BXZ70DRAFT_338346 [Cristinia sonorae]